MISRLDVDFSPTGKELVSGSYDHTIRIWKTRSEVENCLPISRCLGEREQRRLSYSKNAKVCASVSQLMIRVFVVKYSADSKFVLCGSDDTNIRVWKSEASLPLGVVSFIRTLQLIPIAPTSTARRFELQQSIDRQVQTR